MNTEIEVHCVECGKKFTRTHYRQIYCSKECNRQSQIKQNKLRARAEAERKHIHYENTRLVKFKELVSELLKKYKAGADESELALYLSQHTLYLHGEDKHA